MKVASSWAEPVHSSMCTGTCPNHQPFLVKPCMHHYQSCVHTCAMARRSLLTTLTASRASSLLGLPPQVTLAGSSVQACMDRGIGKMACYPLTCTWDDHCTQGMLVASRMLAVQALQPAKSSSPMQVERLLLTKTHGLKLPYVDITSTPKSSKLGLFVHARPVTFRQ